MFAWGLLGRGGMHCAASGVACALLGFLVGCSPGKPTQGATVGGPDTGNTSENPPAENLPPVVAPTNEETLYQQPPPPDCGDGEKGDDEACDDGNRVDGDGCSANCLVVENGF
jgi:cysteine-rich repeat protein